MSNKSTGISPFANESESLSIGGLTVENRVDRVSVYGSIDFTRDREGLTNAESLKTVIDNIVATLKADNHLPDKINIRPAEVVRNPFDDKGDKS